MTCDPTLVRIASTTSVPQSGLAEQLRLAFLAFQNSISPAPPVIYNLDWRALGSGAAMTAARDGEADVVVAHDRIGEMEFWAERFALTRHHVFYNYFVLVGPLNGPVVGPTLADGFQQVYNNNPGVRFVSRGEPGRSGTWIREQQIWQKLGNTPTVPGNVDPSAPDPSMMGTIQETYDRIVNKSQLAYTMTDIGTWYEFVALYSPDLARINMLTSPNDYLNPPDNPERDSFASNQYVVMPVNPNACFEETPDCPINVDGARAFLAWMHTSSGMYNARDVVNTYYPDDEHQGFIYNANSEHFPDDKCLIKPIA